MKFQIENIGKIEFAEIELKPLTIFIGQNGSGKTYTATALWGVLNYINNLANKSSSEQKDLAPQEKNIIKNIKDIWENKFDRLINECLNTPNKEQSLIISKEEIINIHEQINDYLKSNTSLILGKVFNCDLFENPKLDFHNIELSDFKIVMIANTLPDEAFPLLEKLQSIVGVEHQNGVYISDFSIKVSFSNKVIFDSKYFFFGLKDRLNQDQQKKLKENIFYYLFLFSYFGKSGFDYNVKNLHYIPAARTGLMFGLNSILGESFKLSMNNMENNNNQNFATINSGMPLPLNEFIYKIFSNTSRKNRVNKRTGEIVKDIKNILDGIVVHKKDKKGFEFYPNKTNKSIPLSVTSSLVTELSALSLFFDSTDADKLPLIFFEEPEAHLHLSAQKEIAKVITKMINQGYRMVITTHSATFLQQVNNLVLLNDLKDKKDLLRELDIDPKKETISKDKVAIYDFQCDDGRTKVVNVPFLKYGFVVESLNKVLIKISDETSSILEQINLAQEGEI
ncbi:MAG: AAA family ATPase [Conchiformibius sp.]|nr:AAA family ATPase [Conchiformibius sp.]